MFWRPFTIKIFSLGFFASLSIKKQLSVSKWFFFCMWADSAFSVKFLHSFAVFIFTVSSKSSLGNCKQTTQTKWNFLWLSPIYGERRFWELSFCSNSEMFVLFFCHSSSRFKASFTFCLIRCFNYYFNLKNGEKQLFVHGFLRLIGNKNCITSFPSISVTYVPTLFSLWAIWAFGIRNSEKQLIGLILDFS